MLKKAIIIFIFLFVVGCEKDEVKTKTLEVEGQPINYTLESNGDYMVPLNLILNALEIEYEEIEDSVLFGDIKITLDSDIANVGGNPRKLNKKVMKKSDNVLVSLDFLTKNVSLSFIEDDEKVNIRVTSELLLDYEKALEVFEESVEAVVTDIESGKSFNVKRVEGGFTTLADVETLTAEDTDILLSIIGGEWNNIRRSILVEVNGTVIAGSLAPFPHSGSDDHPFGEVVDNRSGNTGSGVNLNSIRDNNMTGVIDIYFYNSITPGLNRIDERHQEKVIEASYFYRWKEWKNLFYY